MDARSAGYEASVAEDLFVDIFQEAPGLAIASAPVAEYPVTDPPRRPRSPGPPVCGQARGGRGRRHARRRASSPNTAGRSPTMGRACSLAVLLALTCYLAGCGGNAPAPTPGVSPAATPHVQITNTGKYYSVVLDYSAGTTAYALGQEYGTALKTALPTIETLIDGYEADMLGDSATLYQAVLTRARAIKPQLDTAYREEIRGIASRFSGGTTNTMGDGKVSQDELLLLNLIPDVARTTQCSAFSVFGARSATGKTITARLLDWGTESQLPRLQAVTTIRNGTSSVCLIGYLAFQGALTGFSDEGVFAGVLDSETGAAYPSPTGLRSYPFDLRHALETQATLATAAAYMSSASRHYAFNHNVLFSDTNTSRVLENDLSGTRALRTPSSALNSGITWGLSNALGCVNSFVLKGNHDNHTGEPWNYLRWNNGRTQLSAKGKTVTVAELKAVACYRTEDDGCIYHDGNQMIVLFQPATRALQIAFRPRNNVLPAVPAFTAVTVTF